MENKNEIIEAEYREIESCDLPTITGRNQIYFKSMNNMQACNV